MKVKSASELLDSLDEEFAWRQKELTAMRSDIKSASSATKSLRLRAGVTMLYAHWEGYVKFASEQYLIYVASKRLKYDELSSGFLALSLQSKLKEFIDTNNISAHIDFISFLFCDLKTRAKIPTKDIIKTGSNLSSERLKTIIVTLGLDYSFYELKEKLIDSELLNMRNTIAHGKWKCPNENNFDLLYQETTTLLRNFKDQIENAVSNNIHQKKVL